MKSDTQPIRGGVVAFVAGAALTALSGALVQSVVMPASDVSDERWSYPWTTGAFVPISLAYLVFHLLVAVGLVAFGRSGVAGTSRAARAGVRLAVAGTLLLAAGEVASIPIRDALVDDTSAVVVGAVYGVGSLVSAIGLLLAGKATLSAGRWHDWRRYTPLVAGLWTTALVGIAATDALPAGVAVYGACLLAMALALRTELDPASAPAAEPHLERA